MSVVKYINMYCILSDDQQIANEWWFSALISSKPNFMVSFDCLKIMWLGFLKQHIFENCEKC